jgi:hypothetical protein
MKKAFLVLALILFSSDLIALAEINKIRSNAVFEGETVKVRGTKFNSSSNPLKAVLIDGTGNQFGSDLTTNRNKKGFSFVAPSVERTRTFLLRISGGNVAETAAQDFPIVIFNSPDLSNPDPGEPEGELEVKNLTTETVTFNNTELSGDTQGQLLWAGQRIADDENSLYGQRLVIEEISLQSSVQGTLLWNSHPIITDQGQLAATTLASTGNGQSGNLNLLGNGTLNLQLNNEITTLETSSQGGTLSLPPSGQVLSVIRAVFDQSVDTGVTGFTDLTGAVLPPNARVTRVWYEVTQTLQSATDSSLIGLSIPGDDLNGLVTPILISDGSNPWDQGAHVGIQNGLLTNMSELTTAKRNIQLSIAGEAITAGRAVFFIEYMMLP